MLTALLMLEGQLDLEIRASLELGSLFKGGPFNKIPLLISLPVFLLFNDVTFCFTVAF